MNSHEARKVSKNLLDFGEGHVRDNKNKFKKQIGGNGVETHRPQSGRRRIDTVAVTELEPTRTDPEPMRSPFRRELWTEMLRPPPRADSSVSIPSTPMRRAVTLLVPRARCQTRGPA